MVDGDDCPSGISDGTFAPTLTDVTLLSFNVTVGGVLFEMTDDDTFPDFPVVLFDVGTPIEIDFRTDSNIIPSLVIVPSNDSVEFVDAAGELSEGVVLHSTAACSRTRYDDAVWPRCRRRRHQVPATAARRSSLRV